MLGVEAYGKVAFAQVMMAYLVLLVDYGFSLSASRKIAAHRSDRNFISRTFVATFGAQWSLLLAAAMLGLVIVLSFERLRVDLWLYVAAFTSVVGTALFPIWFLQGLERLQAVAVLQVLSRLLAVIPIFVFVKEPEDAVWVLVIGGVGSLLGGIGALWWMQRERLIDWVWPGWSAVISELHEGSGLFGSRVSISLYTMLVPLVLGWVAGPVALAYFNLADKPRQAAQSLIGPIFKTLYPRMSNLFTKDRAGAILLLKRSGAITLSAAAIMSLMLWFCADFIIHLLGGDGYAGAVNLLRVLAPVPFFIAVSNLFGVQMLLASGETRIVNITASIAGVTALVLLYPLIATYSAQGAAALILMTEIIVASVYAIAVIKRELRK